MPSLTKNNIVFLVISLTAFLFLFASEINAAPFNWDNTYSHPGRGRYIKFSTATNNTVYVSVDHNGAYDLLKSTDNGQNWLSIKGDLAGGSEINWISDFATNPNVILISVWGSGIFITENSGSNWVNIFPALSSLVVQPHPEDLNKIYVGIGGNNIEQSGLYKSIDKGASWTKDSIIGTRNIGQIHFDPSNNSTIYVVSDPKYYRTDDSSLTWIQLGLDRFFTKGTVFDKFDSQTIYSARFDFDEGVYKSTNKGATWEWKLSGPSGKLFQIISDTDNSIFATRIASNPNGGVWRSGDGAETWENVQDPSWGDVNTWGIDAKNGTVVVSVEGLGIFVATNSGTTPTPTPTPSPTPTPTPTPVPGPNPVVVIPGFGGSFSTKKFVLQQESNDYHDWTMFPVNAPEIYNPFLTSLQNAFYLQNNKVFFFAYDYTKSVAETGQWLNDYLQNEVINNNPSGTKVDLVGHSMGGLVARYCFEKVSGCADKIDQIVSAGTPHKGAVDDYFLWEGAEFKGLDPLTRAGAKFLLHFYGLPKWDKLNIIQNDVIGARDFMPVFEYFNNKNYSDLTIGKNPVLETDLAQISTNFKVRTFSLSGNRPDSTTKLLAVNPPNKKEQVGGYWIDGKPTVVNLGTGDGTVLEESSKIDGGIKTESYSLEHVDYLNTDQPVSDILHFLGLPNVGIQPQSQGESATVYYSSSPFLEINGVSPKSGKISKPSKNVLFEVGALKPGKKQISVSSQIGGTFVINGWFTDNLDNDKSSKPASVYLFPGEQKTVTLQFN